MAVLVIADNPGGDAAMDQRMTQELGYRNATPPGALVRLAGPTANGWRVISVWDSEDAFRKFEREQLMPTFQRLGRSAPTFQVSPLESVTISPTAATQAAR
jgi:hypothetical protein